MTTVLTPYLGGSAVELSGTWRKRLLPIGEINYKGRVLKFTRQYLQQLARSFSDGAYDQVPLQLAGADNAHTNAIERFAGTITGADVQPDGLWITVRPTERGEAILQENPMLGVSARIVEGYDRADGKFYPAALQHVLCTHDPRITGLGSWQAVEASNDDGIMIDLSGCGWDGEPAFEFSGYDVRDERPWETAMVDQVLAELDELAAEAMQYGLTPAEYEDMIAGGQALANQYDRAIQLAQGDVAVLTDRGLICPACGFANDPDSAYCTECGTSMGDPSGWRQAGDSRSAAAFAGDSAAVELASAHDAILELAGIPASEHGKLAGSAIAIELAGGGGLADIDQRMRQLHAQGRRYWAEEDARPRTASSEIRLSNAMERIADGTYLPGAMVAFGNGSQREVLLSQLRDSQLDLAFAEVEDGQVVAGLPCSALDAYGRCAAAYHEAGCSSLAVVAGEHMDAYLDMLRITALLPANESSDATYSDHVEASSGQRLSHSGYDIFETGTSRRELISIGKRQVYGDPDSDDGQPNPFASMAGTRGAVAQYKAQAGLERPHTSREARIAEAALRMPAPRHEDYAPRPERRAARARAMVAVEGTEPVSGSMASYR